MSAPGTLRAGFAALGRIRLILLLTACAALLGGLAASPLAPAMQEAFGETLAGDHLIRNHPEFASVDFIDFVREKAAAVAGARNAILWAALIGLLLQIFFVGGIVETVGRVGPAPQDGRTAFWAGGRRHFAHNLKCFLLFALAAAIVVGGWLALAGGIGKKLFANAAPHSGGHFAWGLAAVVVALLLFGGLKLLADFARAARRDTPSIGAFAAFRDARRRLRGRWLRGLALLLFWAVLAAAGIALLISLAWGPTTPTGASVFLQLVLLALLLAVRPAGLVGAWGSILALFDGSAPPPEREWLRAASSWTPHPAAAVAGPEVAPAPPLAEPSRIPEAPPGAPETLPPPTGLPERSEPPAE